MSNLFRVLLVVATLCATGGPGLAAAHFEAQRPKDLYMAKRIAEIRDTTAKYQDLQAARATGYVQASGNLPLLGYRFANPSIKTFAFERSSALLYLKQGERWQLTGVEYAVQGEERPAMQPFPGIAWTREPAACRY